MLGWLGWQEGCSLPQREYSSSEIADSMVETAEGLAFGAERTPQEWMNGYEWAMVLDDVGNIRWNYGLPQELNHAYTPAISPNFSRWYLADYPVFCWTEPYGLFVIGLPKGEPVEVQHLQLTGLCPEHGAGAPGSSAGNAAAGSGSLLLAELAGASGWRPWQTVWILWRRADRPAAYRRFAGNWQKAEPDRGAAASQNEMLSRRDTPAPSGSQGSAMTCALRWR